MILHVPLRCEPLGAYAALEGLLVSMNAHMNDQVWLLRERLRTALHRAAVGLGTPVEMHVSLQPALPGKTLPAIRHLADKSLIYKLRCVLSRPKLLKILVAGGK